ncbi:hypothetical protein WDW89_04355 [Deltaproteobacteria bacterium TL4]
MNTTKTLISIFVTWVTLTSIALGVPGLRISATNQLKLNNNTMNVNGSVTINSSATLALGTGTLRTSGSWNQYGVFNPGTGLVVFNGTEAQDIGVANGAIPTFYNLNINNPLGVGLLSNVVTNGALNLATGRMFLEDYNLTLGASASIVGASSSNFIVTGGSGMLTRIGIGATNTTFPVGSSNSSYTPLTLKNDGTTDTFSVRAQAITPSHLTDATRTVAVEWLVNEATPGGSNVAITVQWNASDENVAFNADGEVKVGRWNNKAFDVHTPTSNTQRSVTVSGLTSLESFVVAHAEAMIRDLQAPLFDPSGPLTSEILTTGLNVDFQVDEKGQVYYVVVLDGAEAPSIAEIAAGKAKDNTEPLAAGVVTVTDAGTDLWVKISGLTTGRAYDVYLVAQDQAVPVNFQSHATKLDVSTAGIEVSEITNNTNEDGTLAFFTVKLTSKPTSPVTFNVSSSNPNEGQVVPKTLEFTPENWDQLKTVIVVGVKDQTPDGDQNYTIVLSPVISADPGYADFDPADVAVVNEDDGSEKPIPQTVSLGESKVMLPEGNNSNVTENADGTKSVSFQPEGKQENKVELTMKSDGSMELNLNRSEGGSKNAVQTKIMAPKGAEMEIDSAGNTTIQVLTPEGNVIRAVVKNDAKVQNEVWVKGSDGTALKTQVNAPKGGITRIGDQATSATRILRLAGESTEIAFTTTVNPNSRVRGLAQSVTLQIMSDGTLHGISNLQSGETALGQSQISLPAGALADMSARGAILASLSLKQPNTQLMETHTAVNADGQTQIRILEAPTRSYLLPKVEKTGTVVVQQEEGSVGTIVINMPLEKGTSYYLGRDVNEATIHVSTTSSAQVRIERQLQDTHTTFSLSQGTGSIQVGEADKTNLPLAQQHLVQNSEKLQTLSEGSNIVTIPVNTSFSAADLEVAFAQVHSIWKWNTLGKEWQVYSPQLEVQLNFEDQMRLAPMVGKIKTGEGLWIYTEEAASTVVFPDDSPTTLAVNPLVNGWHLLGNNTESGVSLQSLVSLNAAIRSIWKWQGGQWYAYSPDAEISTLIGKEPTIKKMEGLTQIESGKAFWVEVENNPSAARSLRVPPSL